MTGWLILGSAAAGGAFDALAGLCLIYRLLHTRRPAAGALLASAAGMGVIAAAAGAYGFHTGRMAAEIIWLVFCAHRFLRADVRMGLYVSVYFGMAVEFWRFLLSMGMGILLADRAFWNQALIQGQAARWLLNLLLAVMAAYVARRADMARQEAFRLSSAIALAGFFAVITLGAWNAQNGRPIPEDTVSMWVVQAVVLLMSVLVFYISRQYETEKELARLKSEQAELLERDYTTLNQAYAVNARLFHDFHNHIGVLRSLLMHGTYEEAVQYLDSLQKPIEEMADTVWTGDETADYLINSKAAAAKEKQIRFEVQAEFPRHTNIRSADLCAILGNLLDNAIEAAEQVFLPEERSISLTIRRINQMLVIKVENSCAAKAEQENGELKTTKTGGGLHGWGLKSVRAAAEKYDGVVQTSYEGARFWAVATLSYEALREGGRCL